MAAPLTSVLNPTVRSRSTILRGNTQGSVHRLQPSITKQRSQQVESDVHAQIPSLEIELLKDHGCKSSREFILSTATLTRVADSLLHNILRKFAQVRLIK